MLILKVSIRQVKAARSLLAWSQEKLAEASGVSIPTIKRLEAEDGELGGRADTGDKIITALEAAGVEFTNGEQPGVRMKAFRAHVWQDEHFICWCWCAADSDGASYVKETDQQLPAGCYEIRHDAVVLKVVLTDAGEWIADTPV